MNSTETVAEPTKTLAELKAEMDAANVKLQKAVRKAKVPDDFYEEKTVARRAYRAYWSAYEKANPMGARA